MAYVGIIGKIYPGGDILREIVYDSFSLSDEGMAESPSSIGGDLEMTSVSLTLLTPTVNPGSPRR